MEFLVSDAERLFAEGGKVKHLSFWAYKIMTRSTLPSYQNPPLFPRVSAASLGAPTNCIVGAGYVDFCTWHRYSDFEWLVERLQDEFPGTLFPPIPEKETDGTKDKLSDLFSGAESETSKENPLVQKRIRRLQLFFNVISKFTATHESKVLKAFLSMEEAEWIIFKEDTTARAKQPVGWESIKSKSFSLFNAIANVTKAPAVIFPPDSPIARIRQTQAKYSDEVRVCMAQLLNVVRATQSEPKQVVDDGTISNANKPIPAPLCYNGHIVKSARDENLSGVVRHVDNETAWVIWNGQSHLTATPIAELVYPPSGVSDPCIFAMNEVVQQIESFFVYLCFRPDAREMEHLVDLLWFWFRYGVRVCETIDGLEKLERDRLVVLEEAKKKSEEPKKQELLQRAAAMKDRFDLGCAKVAQEYRDYFRPHARKALVDAMLAFGKLSVSLLTDDDWEQRLLRADSALPLLFDVPQEVLSGHVQQYAPTAPPQQQYQAPPPQQQQYQAPPPQQREQPVNAPRKNSTWAEPIPTDPLDSDAPPPPPPATQPTAPPAEHHQDPGLADGWQYPSQKRQDSDEAAHSDVPPPPPDHSF